MRVSELFENDDEDFNRMSKKNDDFMEVYRFFMDQSDDIDEQLEGGEEDYVVLNRLHREAKAKFPKLDSTLVEKAIQEAWDDFNHDAHH